MVTSDTTSPALEAAHQLRHAAVAKKCAPCGCAHETVATIRSASSLPSKVTAAAEELAGHLTDVHYDCLGCTVCWPAEALGALIDAGLIDPAPACPTQPAEARPGWPPLPGSYTVNRWAAPVAVCTLADTDLADTIAARHHPAVSIVGTLATENLGIERLIHNTITNPNIGYVVLAGTETRQRIGHLPGASLLALATNGTNPDGRIIDAPGRRPVVTNLAVEEIVRFRTSIDVIDLIGCTDVSEILNTAADAAARHRGPTDLGEVPEGLAATPGQLAEHMTPDPAGYFVIYPDPARRLLRLEHYTNAGLLDHIIEGPTPAHCYTTAVSHGLLTRLDHAAYLGQELARAHASLDREQPFVQDAAPESNPNPSSCGGPARVSCD